MLSFCVLFYNLLAMMMLLMKLLLWSSSSPHRSSTFLVLMRLRDTLYCARVVFPLFHRTISLSLRSLHRSTVRVRSLAHSFDFAIPYPCILLPLTPLRGADQSILPRTPGNLLLFVLSHSTTFNTHTHTGGRANVVFCNFLFTQ
ncbi:hypothetical protein BKA57DRAFT_458785 [Linnemannia elongata]|nr:hypothetical protein BKA57DRAFT_458785 [Linnemannia elongata]